MLIISNAYAVWRSVLINSRLLVLMVGLVLMLNGQPTWSETKILDTPKPIMLLIGKDQDLIGCKSLGPVTGTFEAGESDLTYPQRLIIARDNLYNKTRALGGNTVHVLHTINTARYEVPGIEQKIAFSGNAYACE